MGSTGDAMRSVQAGASELFWKWLPFGELSLAELYAALQLRQHVFVVEQTCPYPDIDGLDDRAWHLLGFVPTPEGTRLGAYARVFAPGAKFAEASIGRIVTDPSVRRSGLGRQLVAEAIRRVEQMLPGAPIRIGAQLYLERFYGEFGFHRDSEPYDEDGIPHIEMLRTGAPRTSRP
jgi:ElaA protein